MSAQLRPEEPGDRPLRCGAFRTHVTRTKVRKVTCEKVALHGFACVGALLPAEADAGLRKILKADARKHAGRDASGRWHFWGAS